MNAQQLIIGHLLPIAAAIAVLWLVYRLLFVNSNRLRFNRCYLIAAMLFSLGLPLIGTLVGNSSPQMAVIKENLLGGTLLNEITVTPEGQPLLMPEVEITAETAPAQPHYSLWQILGGIYLTGVGVMTLFFLIKLGKLIVLIARSPKEKREGYTAVFMSPKVPEPAEGPTQNMQGSFSFLHYAFFPDESVAPDIIRHERSHIAHHHSADILFVELMMILQWFNPFIYRYKKELQSLHEYQADRDVVATGVDKRNYMMLILQQCTAVDFSGMSNNFSLILTKKRIKMITRNEKAKGLWWRLLATLPVLAVLLIANTKVTAQEQKSDDKLFTVEFGQFEIFDDDGFPMQLKDTVLYNDDGSYFKFETSDALDPISGEMRKKVTVTSFNADGIPSNNFKINEVEKHGDTTTYAIDPFTISADKFNIFKITSDEDINVKVKHVKNDTIYQEVDQMPEFPGGMEAMMKFVASNIQYPQDAIDEGLEGRIMVSFVVEKDGLVSNVKVLKGVCESIDEEAARVVRGMPKWKPGMKDGKPVRVSYQIPIVFKLGQLNNEHKTTVKTIIAGDDEHSCKASTATYPDNPAEDKMQPDKDGVYQIVEQMPEFPGGTDALMKYVVSNIKYPQDAIDEGKSGRVFVSFIVERDGYVSNVKVKKGICESIDKEAVRVISSMPRWYAGMHKGEPVRVSYMMPIKFEARDLTGDSETDAAMVRMEDENGHSYHIDRSVETTKTKMQPDKNGVYQIVEEMPSFPGGEQALIDYVSKNVVYPQEARDKEISGRVFVSFVVEKDGSVNEVKVMRGIGGGCDEEAVRVIKSMPKWKPGKQEGKPVRVSYMMPINFKLTEKQPKKE